MSYVVMSMIFQPQMRLGNQKFFAVKNAKSLIAMTRVKMKTKGKFTNEDVAEALEWWEVWDKGKLWRIYGTEFQVTTLLDFKNDMNAATKCVWPKIVEIISLKWGVDSIDVLMEIALNALQSPNPALALCEELMKAKEK